MGFTDLILRSPSGKAIFPSHYDEELVDATIKKINKALNQTNYGKLICNAIGSNLENSNYARLSNYVITSVLKFINSTLSICNLKHNRSKPCNSKCISSDLSNIDFLKFF